MLPNPDLQQLSVRLPAIAPFVQLSILFAALAISTLIPVAIFLVFQRRVSTRRRPERLKPHFSPSFLVYPISICITNC